MTDHRRADEALTDRSPCDEDMTELMLGIVKAMDRPRYPASRDPMDLLTSHDVIFYADSSLVCGFLKACDESGRRHLGEAMSRLVDFMRTIDRLIGEEGTRPLNWDVYEQWGLMTSASRLRASFERAEEDHTGLPDDFIATDLLSGVTLKPYIWDEMDAAGQSRFEVRMEPATQDGRLGSHYMVFIDWES